MSASHDYPLPRAVALAWGVAADPQRGPKRGLSIERIVETGIEIADEGGLESVSMSAIASRLDFTTMSLYRYVTAKDELIVLMGEQALGVPPEQPDPPLPWREGLGQLTTAMLAAYTDHPWLIDVPISGIPVTPNELAWLDQGLAFLEGTALDHAQRVSITLMLSGFARWKATVYRGYDIASSSRGSTPDELDAVANELMHELITDDRFPALAPALRAGALGADTPDPFAFALELFLDGVESAVQTAASDTPFPEPPTTPAPAPPKDKAVREAARIRRESESALREARRKEAEAIAKSRERAAKAAKSR
ncbi:TetR/AcrR family transcriptional regulator [Paramicrobacterium chengjingii]|uniref:TetR/AcrR family transcriptional regulator C-terminal domain-containing protein n=1 Tax=Paramicrobacterium chengjingii TaxID=2769067 RepID=A0ABX6YEP9_9MICO|nr:TetR/AcrR family transcriptional regulator C-terminal domain-containing protein [Microbacterium chengjingii]QPZ37242.1 TetR/AcrR family transcriptional regulator C-terminal domain-containing protein [Microbacterium chengjingii]